LLDSWKEISRYLRREVRTVQRWEKSEGLPIHRHFHNRLSSVYAYPHELDAWMAKRDQVPTEAGLAETALPLEPEPTQRTADGGNFVGRRDEYAELSKALERALAGQGSFVGIAGEAGLGKTTLVERFLRQTYLESMWVGRGCSSERLAGTEPYLPFLEATESLIQNDDSRITQTLKSVAPAWHAEIMPGEELLSTSASPEPFKDRMQRELTNFLRELSKIKPVVLFLDDLHWADLSTLDTMSHLAAKLPSMRVLLIAAYRPEELSVNAHPFSAIKADLEARKLCREIELTPLSRHDVAEYLDLEFPRNTFSEDVLDLAAKNSEGNPLFMVDMLRYLRDQSVIANTSTGWVVTENLAKLRRELPRTLQRMITRKIDRLHASDRTLLQAASIQGDQFDSAVLANVLDIELEMIEERLTALDHNHLLVAFVREEELPNGTLSARYRFVHVLYQNVLWDAVPGNRRIRWSSKAAHALLQLYGEHHTAVIGELALLHEHAQDFERAVKYYTLAAQHAVRVFANQEAITLAHKAERLLQRLPDHQEHGERELQLQLILRIPITTTDGYGSEGLQEIFQQVHRLSANVEQDLRVIPVIWGEFLYHTTRANFGEAFKRAEELRMEGDRRNDRDILAHAHQALLSLLTHCGDPVKAWKHFEEGMACYSPDRSQFHINVFGRDPGIGLLCMGSLSAWTQGFPDRAVRLTRRAIELARSVGHPHSLALAYLFAAWIHFCRREAKECKPLADTLDQLCVNHDLSTLMGWCSVVKPWILASSGYPGEGVALLKRNLQIHWTPALQLHRPTALATLAEMLLADGKLSEALETIDEAISRTRQTGQEHCLPEVLRIKAQIYAAMAWRCKVRGSRPANEFRIAQQLFLEALQTANRQGAKSFELRAAVSLCRLHHDFGRSDGSARLRAVHDWFTEGFSTPDFQQARQLLNR